MKPSLLSIALAALSLPGAFISSAWSQTPVPQAPANTPSQGQLANYNGVVYDQGVPFLVRNGQVIRLDQVVIPAGQMLTQDGQFVPLPSQLTGPNSSAQINTGGNAPQSFNNNRRSGLAIQNGTLYLVVDGTANAVNAGAIPAGSMVNFQGQFVPVPALTPSSVNSQPANPNATNAPGRTIPGFTPPGAGTPGTVPPGFATPTAPRGATGGNVAPAAPAPRQ